MNSKGQFVLTAFKSIKLPDKKCCNCHLNNCRPPEKAVSHFVDRRSDEHNKLTLF